MSRSPRRTPLNAEPGDGRREAAGARPDGGPAPADEPAARRRQPAEERADAIIGAALEEFADKGYAGARLDDVAARAGISKGLVYVYFETKEALFKAVVRRLLIPRFERVIADIEASKLPVADILRGPLLAFMQGLPRSRLRVVLRLMIAEGPKHPDLTQFYHQEVIARGMGLLRGLMARGLASGELKPNAIAEFPHLFVAPMLVAVVWSMLFDRHAPLDSDRMLAAHVELIIAAISAEPHAGQLPSPAATGDRP